MFLPKTFGGPLRPDHTEQYRRSVHWRGDRFENLEPTELSFSPSLLPRIIYKQLSGRRSREPIRPLPVRAPDHERWFANAGKTHVIWYGHSTILLHMGGKTILIDPMFGPDASPVGPIRTKRFSTGTLDIPDQFPSIDLVLISHDHYDHLDLASIERIRGKANHFLVALGVGRHLVRWGIPADRITEFDWWEANVVENITVTFTPTRHFSGRGLRDRMRSLWGGWAIRHGEEQILFSGDSGYGRHFREIGERLGPFDLGLMECGQYNEYWRDIHMFPDESVQAAIDAGVRHAVPVHWGSFSLSFQHAWHEPAEHFLAAAKRQGLPVSTPRLGEAFAPGEISHDAWWRAFL